DNIKGEIRASGVPLNDTGKTTNYDAVFIGKSNAAEVNQVKENMKALNNFKGQFKTKEDAFGIVDLNQANEKLIGTYNVRGGGNIEGNIYGESAFFDWQDKEKQGYGILRIIHKTGLIVGMFGYTKENQNDVKYFLIDSYEINSEKSETNKTNNKNIESTIYDKTVFYNKHSIDELKDYGKDLAISGQCSKAISLLEEASEYYNNQLLKLIEDKIDTGTIFFEVKDSIINELSISNYLNDCYFKLGKTENYEKLISNLTNKIYLLDLLKSDKEIERLFQFKTNEIINNIDSFLDNLGIILKAYTRIYGHSPFKSIGINFHKDSITQDVIIDSIDNNSSASNTGILSGDILVKINEKYTKGMNLDDIFNALPSEEGSIVKLTINHKNQQSNYELVQTLIKIPAKDLGEEFIETIYTLIRSIESLQNTLLSYKKLYKEKQQAVSNKQEEPIQALNFLRDSLYDVQLKTRETKNKLINTINITYKQYDELLDMLSSLYNMFTNISSNVDSSTTVKETIKLENNINNFVLEEKNISYFKKGLFKGMLLTYSVLEDFQVTIKSNDLIEKFLKETNLSKKDNDLNKQILELANYLELWRKRLALDSEKITTLEKSEVFYKKLIDFFVNLKDIENALFFSEAARGRAFADLINSKDDIKKILTTIQLKQEYYIPSITSRPALKIEDIKAIVKNNRTIIIEYYFSETSLNIWIIAPSGQIHFVKQPLKSELFDNIKQFDNIVLEKINKKEVEIHNILRYLYDAIVGVIPQELLFSTDASPNIITIIPHGVLFHIPFGALKDSENKYLIQKIPIVYSISIDTLKYTDNTQGSSNVIKHNLLALVNPTPTTDENNLELLDETEELFDLINNFYPEQQRLVLYRDKATKQALIEQAPKYNIIYFGAHGEASDNEPLDSRIFLTKTNSDNGQLKIPDIFYKLDINADMVFLAGCKTGMGKITGDGINGISRAFLWVGAKSLLTNLWIAPEKIALQQMAYFHHFWLKEGNPKVIALKKAQEEMIKEFPNQPQLWAAPAMYGQWK
ncbi:MAG: CHAT domain-containing protein, partial [Candidatus Magnetoovum sp. WYHC-5]|nr:CHAT domain-containing protein [Candidatus Magnetoovum sp. WYHC-5]